jgi:hypothetical protein
VLFIVIITTVILGGAMPKYIKWNIGQIKDDPEYDGNRISVRESTPIDALLHQG